MVLYAALMHDPWEQPDNQLIHLFGYSRIIVNR